MLVVEKKGESIGKKGEASWEKGGNHRMEKKGEYDTWVAVVSLHRDRSVSLSS